MAPPECCPKRNSPRRKLCSPLSTHIESEVSRREEKNIVKGELTSGASQSTRQSSEEAQDKQKEIDQQVEPRREKLDLESHATFSIDHQDSEESEEEFEGLTYEEFKETEGYTLFSKYLRGTTKNSNGN